MYIKSSKDFAIPVCQFLLGKFLLLLRNWKPSLSINWLTQFFHRDCSWGWELPQKFPRKIQPSCVKVSIFFSTFRPLRIPPWRLTTHRVTLRSLTSRFGFFWKLLWDSAHGVKPLHSNEVSMYKSCLISIKEKKILIEYGHFVPFEPFWAIQDICTHQETGQKTWCAKVAQDHGRRTWAGSWGSKCWAKNREKLKTWALLFSWGKEDTGYLLWLNSSPKVRPG